MHAHTYIVIYKHVHVSMHSRTHMCSHTCILMCTHIHNVHAHTYTNVFPGICMNAHVYMFAHTFIPPHLHSHTLRYMHTHTHVLPHICIHSHLHSYMHSDTRTHVYTHIHAYTVYLFPAIRSDACSLSKMCPRRSHITRFSLRHEG